MKDKTPAYQKKAGEEAPIDKIKKGSSQRLGDDSGVGQSRVRRKKVKFIEGINNHVISHNGGHIVFGSDRPSGLEGGTGAAGFTKTSTIDIVVGRASKNIDTKKKRSESDEQYVGNLFTRDAARIYISESTLIDKNFGLATGPRQSGDGKNTHPVSSIGIKADAVRVIGTEGVNIVTGPAKGFSGKKERNTLGGKVPQAGAINLIAGNYTDNKMYFGSLRSPGVDVLRHIPYLQPAIKGDFLVSCLNELINYCDALESGLFNIATTLQAQNSSLASALSPINPPAAGICAGAAFTFSIFGTTQSYLARKYGLKIRKKFLTYGREQHIRSPNVYLT